MKSKKPAQKLPEILISIKSTLENLRLATKDSLLATKKTKKHSSKKFRSELARLLTKKNELLKIKI